MDKKDIQLLRVENVADLLACSKSNVWHLTKTGEIATNKLSDRITVWVKSEIEDYIYSKIAA